MRIGVVMPTYNQDTFLPRALQSYYNQTMGSALVVVNDGSTDSTEGVLTKHVTDGLRVVSHGVNKGTAEAINTGMKLLSSEVCDAFSWISSDNEMSPDWLHTLAEAMSLHGAGAVYGGFWYNVPGRPKSYLFKKHGKNRLLNDVNCYYGPAFLIRGDVWDKAGEHRGKISHDYDHWLRVEEACFAKRLPIVGINKPLCDYNAHEHRVTVTRANQFDATHWQAEARSRRGL